MTRKYSHDIMNFFSARLDYNRIQDLKLFLSKISNYIFLVCRLLEVSCNFKNLYASSAEFSIHTEVCRSENKCMSRRRPIDVIPYICT